MWALLAGFVGLTAWTLLGSQPGWLAFGSTVVAALSARYAGRWWPAEGGWVDAQGNFPHWRYVVALLAGVSVFYAPPLIGELQLAFGLVALAAAWTVMGFHTGWPSQEALEAHSNSALIAIALSVVFSAYVVFAQSYQPVYLVVLYAFVGAVLVRLSLGFMIRWLFYLGLVAIGVSCAVVKKTYFPGASFGLTEFVAALALWGVGWWLVRSIRIDSTLGLPTPITQSVEARLLWNLPVERTVTARRS